MLKVHTTFCAVHLLHCVVLCVCFLKKQTKPTLHFPLTTHSEKCIITGCNYILIKLVQHFKGLKLSARMLLEHNSPGKEAGKMKHLAKELFIFFPERGEGEKIYCGLIFMTGKNAGGR